MKLRDDEGEIMGEVKFHKLDIPFGQQVADAMKKLWRLHTNQNPNENHFIFSSVYWNRIITNARTRWTDPLDGTDEHKTPYCDLIKKVRVEGECLTMKGGYCSNTCPTPGVKVCCLACKKDFS
jgi:hypothetical protein